MENFEQRLQEIAAKKEELQQMTDTVRADALEQCRRLVKLFDLTSSELGCRVEEGKPGAASGRGSVAPKYRDPITGKTWSGRGRVPAWFQENIDKGMSREDMKID